VGFQNYNQRNQRAPGQPIEVILPTLHSDQVRAFEVVRRNKLTALRCGRRWGKTEFFVTLGGDAAAKGEPVGYFAPDYKIQAEAFSAFSSTLDPIKRSSSRIEGVIRTITGGRLDFWTLENERAGRSRMYKLVLIDEAAFTKPNMKAIWEQSIAPTLLDLNGRAVVASNTNGIAEDNFFWQICNKPEMRFAEFHAPTINNPLIPKRDRRESDAAYAVRRAETFEALKRDYPPLVYQQEYLADFVDWSGAAFFSLESMLVGGAAPELPTNCDAVFAVVDTATKTGKEHDGTGVVYFALTRHAVAPLIVADWEIQQIEGALLDSWLPNVFARLEELAAATGARAGSLGAWIEDKASGMVLLQQSSRRGLPAHEIDPRLTALGKDERAISVSGYVYRGQVKIARQAHDKVTNYKGATRNHFEAQVTGYRIGDKDAAKRADDLADCFTYGVALSLGDSRGL
jgi:hypothetical protein